MGILADCSNRYREAVKAFGTFVETGANFLLWVCRYPIDALFIRIAAVRANRPVRPSQLLKIVASRFLGREPLCDLHERKIALWVLTAGRGIVLVCHAGIMTESMVL